MLYNAKAFNQNLDPWLKWIDSTSSYFSKYWCKNAICDANTDSYPSSSPSTTSNGPTEDECANLNKKKCTKKKEMCKYSNKKTVSGDCEAKNKKYAHDCVQHNTRELCFSEDNAGLCRWEDGVCSHQCSGLTPGKCKKKKLLWQSLKICTIPKLLNPCFGCQRNSKC